MFKILKKIKIVSFLSYIKAREEKGVCVVAGVGVGLSKIEGRPGEMRKGARQREERSEDNMCPEQIEKLLKKMIRR